MAPFEGRVKGLPLTWVLQVGCEEAGSAPFLSVHLYTWTVPLDWKARRQAPTLESSNFIPDRVAALLMSVSETTNLLK